MIMKRTTSRYCIILLMLMNLIGLNAQQPLSAHNTIYIQATSASYSFVNNDFAFYKSNGDTFAGVIIITLPAAGTLTYNGVAVNQTDVSQATVFSDRTRFSFTPDNNRTATSFTFKLKDSRNVITALPYSVSVKYNTPVSKLVRTATKNYIDYKGLPYLIYGIQLRIDDYLKESPYDATKLANVYQYFERTSMAGFRDASVPIPWNYIETADGTYNFTLIDNYLVNANKYNLRLHFLWFGSNICGWSSVPYYISSNKTVYPLVSTVSQAPVLFTTAKLIEKEVRAVTTLMDYIALKDVNKRVVLVQVENEPDHIGPTSSMWGGGQKTGGYHMLDTLGQVIHRSNADMVTRVNLAGYTTDASDFGSLKGINIVGRDSYSDALSSYQTSSSYFIYPWNSNYTPENGGQYKNVINLILAGLDKGMGYINYELRTTGDRLKTYDLGLYRGTSANDWVERDGSLQVAYSLTKTDFKTEVNLNEVKDFNALIYKADKRIAKSPDSKNAAFNLSDAQTTVNETKTFSTYTVTYTSAVGGEAFAMEDENGDVILMSLKNNSSFAFQSIPANLHVSIGYFDELNVWHQTSSRNITDNTITLNVKEVALLTTTVYISDSTEVPTVNKIKIVNIYPNPNQGKFTMNFSSLDFTPKLMEVYNMNSQLVFSQGLYGKESSFDVKPLKRGLYLLKLSGINTDKTFVNKLIIN